LDAQIENSQDTDYGKFLEYGKMAGVPPNVVLLATDYVYSSGDHLDLRWIWRALRELRIRPNLRKLWFYGWASFLGKRVSQEVLEDWECER
jgi:hypothetical protein